MSSKEYAHLNDLSQLSFLVIDEADRMIKQGSFPQLQQIFEVINDANPPPPEESDDEGDDDSVDDDDDDRLRGIGGVRGEARVVMLDDSILAAIEREREGNGRGGKAGRRDIPTPAEIDDDEYERQRRRLLRDAEEDGGADGGGVGRRRTGRRSPSDVRLFRDADTAAVDAQSHQEGPRGEGQE